MAGKVIRAAVVGASTLLGKELADELNDGMGAVWDLTLLDVEDAGGTVTAAGDQAMVIQPISRDALSNMDVVFFAGERATASEYWKAARAAGASVVDLTAALDGQPQVLLRSPLLEGGTPPDLSTEAVVAAHPAAIMLAMAASRLLSVGLKRMAATVLQPASEAGNAGVEEVHQQTVGLLSFQPLKKEVYDAQIAFNLVASLGSAAKLDLAEMSTRISKQVSLLAPALPPGGIALQLLQAPVFHGYTASVFVEMSADLDEDAVREALSGDASQLQEDDSPSNEMAAGKGDVLFRVVSTASANGNTFWLWIAADNLRLAARNAVACALELVPLRPTKGVQ